MTIPDPDQVFAALANPASSEVLRLLLDGPKPAGRWQRTLVIG